MHICLIVDDYMPNSIRVGAKMMHELACEYKIQGHDVLVLTPSDEIEEDIKIIYLDEVKILYFKNGKIKNANKVQRAINETMLSFNAWRRLKRYLIDEHCDMIIYYSPTIFWSGLVVNLKNLWGSPSYLILRDLFPQWVVDQNIIRKNSIIEKYFRFFENKNYLAADTIGLMSEKNLQWFNHNINLPNKSEILYNWAANTPISKKSKYKKIFNIEDKIVYFYGGNIGHAQDMMNIIRLAENMKSHKQAYFILVGEGDEVDIVKEAISSRELTNIKLLPSVSQEEFKLMLSEFDIGLFTLHKKHTTHNFPGKLLGYMVQGLPILGSINRGNDLKEIVENAAAGIISINGEDEVFYQNAIKLLYNETYRNNMGKRSIELLGKYFSVTAIGNQILEGVGTKSHVSQ